MSLCTAGTAAAGALTRTGLLDRLVFWAVVACKFSHDPDQTIQKCKRISIENPATKAIALADSWVDRLATSVGVVAVERRWLWSKNKPIVGPATIPSKMRARYLAIQLGANVKFSSLLLLARITHTHAPSNPKAKVNK